MKKIFLNLLLLLNISSLVYANDKNINYKDSILYNFNPKLISRIEIFKNNKNTDFNVSLEEYLKMPEKYNVQEKYGILIYNNKEISIDDFSKECANVKLIKKNKENLIKKLPNGCNISFIEEIGKDNNYKKIIYLCSNKGCEKRDIPFECIENNEEDCGF